MALTIFNGVSPALNRSPRQHVATALHASQTRLRADEWRRLSASVFWPRLCAADLSALRLGFRSHYLGSKIGSLSRPRVGRVRITTLLSWTWMEAEAQEAEAD
jgi:hypothetical protein